MKIPITRPDLGEEDFLAVLGPLRSGWLVQGPKVAEFEQMFRDYTRAPFALATTSCTTALHLALSSAGVGPGDEVLVPAFTWVASANVVEHLGARPVFVDVDLASYNLDPQFLNSLISEKTRAILAVSLFGLSADLDSLMDFAGTKGLCVVEDAACAMGSFYRGQHAGTIADYGCFSFHPRKAITTGEGGMLITHHVEQTQLLKSLRDHGASTSDLERHVGPRPHILPEFEVAGYNYRMTDMQAALGVSQMKRVQEILSRRRYWAQAYQAAMSEFASWLRPPIEPAHTIHAFQSYVCLFAPEEPTMKNVERLHEERNALMDVLHQKGISSRPGTHCLHTLKYYQERYRLKPEDFPRAYLCDRLSLSLPLYGQMTPQEHDFVISELRAWARGRPLSATSAR